MIGCRSHLAVLLAALGLASVFIAVGAPQALAASCTATSGGHDGYFYDPSAYPGFSFEGTYSRTVVRDGALCTGISDISNFTNAYVMIAASPYSGTNNGWAQVGWERSYVHGLRWFSQYAATAPGILVTKYPTYGVSLGVNHLFKSEFVTSCLCVVMIVDHTALDSSSFNPYNYWLQPFSPQYEGEAGYYWDNIPGTAAAPTAYSSMGVEYNDGSEGSTPCVLTVEDTHPSRWQLLQNGCQAFNIWTS